MTSLVEFVNFWFDHPGEPSTPERDRIFVYAACIEMLSEIRKSSPSSKTMKNLHRYFTYLLLGWNPITAWPKHSEFPVTENKNEVMPNWECCRETMKELLDFDKPIRNVYPLLVCLETYAFLRMEKEKSQPGRIQQKSVQWRREIPIYHI